MSKKTSTYWNPTSDKNKHLWEEVPDSNGMIEFLTIAEDSESGDYTRLTRFLPGTDTEQFGVKFHDYTEEIYILEGEVYDAAFDRLLIKGDYACREIGEKHGPFKTETGCTILEVSYPSESK